MDNEITKLTDVISEMNVEFVKAISEFRSDLKALTDTVKELSATNTKRLDKHSDELDETRDRLTRLEAFRESEESSKTRNIMIATVIATLFSGAVATLIAFLLQ